MLVRIHEACELAHKAERALRSAKFVDSGAEQDEAALAASIHLKQALRLLEGDE